MLGISEKIEKLPASLEQGTAKSVQRLISYFDMVIYGHLKKDEGSFKIGTRTIKDEFGNEVKQEVRADVAKVIDTFGKYVSIQGLALNLYAGIANVGFGSIMTRIEAMAGRFVSNQDLLYADKTYTKGLPAILGNIGQRNPTDKLNLWIERFDVLQDFEQRSRDLDTSRRTVFTRLMKTSSLFFMNHAGEHWMQTRMSLAMANTIKLKEASRETWCHYTIAMKL